MEAQIFMHRPGKKMHFGLRNHKFLNPKNLLGLR